MRSSFLFSFSAESTLSKLEDRYAPLCARVSVFGFDRSVFGPFVSVFGLFCQYSVVFGLHTEYQLRGILRLYADLTQIASGIRSNCNIKRPIFSFSAAGWLS